MLMERAVMGQAFSAAFQFHFFAREQRNTRFLWVNISA